MSKSVDATYDEGADGDALLSQHLDADGDGTGTHNMNGVYTAGTDDGVFFIAPAANEVFYISHMHIYIEDTAITGTLYGGVTATNGVLLRVLRRDVVIHDFMAGESIKSCAEWIHIMHDATMYEFASGNEFLAASTGFLESYNGPLVLDGSQGEILQLVCQDDLSGLVSHEMLVQGRKATIRSRT
jgi:hypothetical protein